MLNFLLKHLPTCVHVYTTRMLFFHLILCISMFQKFVFTANLLLKAALFLLMKNAGTATVTTTPAALIQHMKNCKTLMTQQNGWSAKKYWVVVQRCQSYLMGRRCLFSPGWPTFWWWYHNKSALWGRCFTSTSFGPHLFLLGWLKLNLDLLLDQLRLT